MHTSCIYELLDKIWLHSPTGWSHRYLELNPEGIIYKNFHLQLLSSVADPGFEKGGFQKAIQRCSAVCVSTLQLGGSGGMPPQKFFLIFTSILVYSECNFNMTLFMGCDHRQNTMYI